MADWIIVGLGNPGPQYEQTRHNAGFWLVDALATEAGQSFKLEQRFLGWTAQATWHGHKIWLLKPTTFMNRSGQALRALAQFYKLSLEQILVVHDELDLLPGVVRFKRGGGHGGHNGLKDIVRQCGGSDFYRCRIGIGHPGQSHQVTDYVLSKPASSDRLAIHAAIDRALQALPDLLDNQAEKAMNWLHSQ